MRIYFSGARGLTYTPEALIPQRKPHVMLTFHDIGSSGTFNRLDAYLERGSKKWKGVYAESIFMDSGAYTLFNDHVEKRREERVGRHGRKLERPIVRRGQGDYSYFNLRKGSDFRKYCDRYARCIKEHKGKRLLFANVDAIQNPDLTWETQRFFEEEHGVYPVPIIHGLTPLEYLYRYLDRGYKRIGLGGLGHHVPFSSYMKWADAVFSEICPDKESRLPQVKVHGFAMTSFNLMCRWPWWSVDSATWVKLAAYGWLYVPYWSEDKGWRFDRPPMQVNVSFGATEEMDEQCATDLERDNWHPLGKKTDKHVDNIQKDARKMVYRWIEKCGVPVGTVDSKGKEVEFGVRSHFRARSICNLHYMKDLEESRPPWPWPLDNRIVDPVGINYHRGFGL